MELQQKPIFASFASQKGGVGKTTFTTLIASVLHYRLGYNIMVVDCDYPQYSLVQTRERDLQVVMENEAFKMMAHQQFRELNKKAYPVVKEKPETALEVVGQLLQDVKITVDMVFFDLPGTVNSPGIIKVLAGMDYIFTPISADRVVMESTLVFTQLITEVLMKRSEVALKAIYLFWNQVDQRERSTLYSHYSGIIKTLRLPLLNSTVAASVRFRKEAETDRKAVFRSTLLPADEKLLKGCGLDIFINEFIKTLQL